MLTFRHEHTIHADPELTGLLRDLNRKLDLIIKNQETMMATLDDVLADVTAETTQIASLSALIDGLKQQVADALAGATLPPATQAKIDEIFTAAEANKAAIAKALAANTLPTP
jgi:hypothetical protein